MALTIGLSAGASQAQTTGLPALGDGESISLSAERQLGDRIARELFRDPDYLEDAVLDEYVQQLWTPLVRAAVARGELSPELQERFAWRILLGRDRSVNAFALPGGYLGVHLGLMAVVSTADELASVLAHELSHVTQRHIARGMSDQSKMTPFLVGSMILGALAASKSPQAAQALIVGGPAAVIQNQLSYTRDMEREADRVGYGILVDAGYDPGGFVSMFGKLQQASGLNDSGAFPYLRSHPLTTERMADMQARQQLNVVGPKPLPDMSHAMMAARARVLSQNSPDALKAWTQGPASLTATASPADQAAALYAACLSHLLLRDGAATQRNLQALGALLQSQRHLPSHAAAFRWWRLLQAEVAERQDNPALAAQLLAPEVGMQTWQRPELMLLAQVLQRLPEHAWVSTVKTQLRQVVQQTPLDAQAWDRLSGLLSGQGQALASLRAAGEAQAARLDWSGAVDRFRAAQEVALKGRLQPGEHIEASIVDVRLRYARERLRGLQAHGR
ncbi:M48 family metalloprotease [Limnohabitans sp. Rim8]|uniref:M48 family metalloprotease n=1 Tax=Limnohabitans sp. Rim8 TaxID=1100718 RepID=UPI002622A8A1|nr:M48 family metalloprotease [Limnohabitans sp. Rim8]